MQLFKRNTTESENKYHSHVKQQEKCYRSWHLPFTWNEPFPVTWKFQRGASAPARIGTSTPQLTRTDMQHKQRPSLCFADSIQVRDRKPLASSSVPPRDRFVVSPWQFQRPMKRGSLKHLHAMYFPTSSSLGKLLVITPAFPMLPFLPKTHSAEERC